MLPLHLSIKRVAKLIIVPCIMIIVIAPSLAVACEGPNTIEITPQPEPGMVPIEPSTLTVTIKNNYSEEGSVTKNEVKAPFKATTTCKPTLASKATCEDLINVPTGTALKTKGELLFALLFTGPPLIEVEEGYKLEVK